MLLRPNAHFSPLLHSLFNLLAIRAHRVVAMTNRVTCSNKLFTLSKSRLFAGREHISPHLKVLCLFFASGAIEDANVLYFYGLAACG